MKKLFCLLALFTLIMCVTISCTKLQRTKFFGAKTHIYLESGEKLKFVTFKDNSNLWVLVEDMEKDYKPKVYNFKEYSSYGIFKGNVYIYEK